MRARSSTFLGPSVMVLATLLWLPACVRFVPQGVAADGGAVPADGGPSTDQGDGSSRDARGDADRPRDSALADGATSDIGRDLGEADLPAPDLLTPDLSPSPDQPQGPDAPVGPVTVGKAHDTCQTAFEIDLASLSSGTIEFWIDTAGATSTFDTGACAGRADVHVRLRNATGMRAVSCTSGGGTFGYAELFASTCTQIGKTNVGANCLGGTTASPHPTTDYVLVLCRDATLPPARIRIVNGP